MSMVVRDFDIGVPFYRSGAPGRVEKWLCTDVGTRVVAAVRADRVLVHTCSGTSTLDEDQARMEGWFNGPPYALHEVLFDETELEVCYMSPEAARDAEEDV